MVHALGAAPIRVLIVEDNRDICENIAAYLETRSYILDFAYDGISDAPGVDEYISTLLF